ncbi:MAG: 16S rRNA (cytosine(967)-C(5))-methyltransferase RsmB [Burkholderiaceae bacterium]
MSEQGLTPLAPQRSAVAVGAAQRSFGPPLWRQLQATAQSLQCVREGQSLTSVLQAIPVNLRPGTQALTFHVLRWLGYAQAVRRQLVSRQPTAAADALLCTALALTEPLGNAPYDVYTLVDQTVEAAKRQPALRTLAPFINACMRRYLRECDALAEIVARDPVAQWNHPLWWIQQVKADHPAHWQLLLQRANVAAPMVLRINKQKTTVAQYLDALNAIHKEAKKLGDQGLILSQPCPVQQLPGFEQGWVSVQDGAAQMAAPLLLKDLVMTEPLHVLDACAAPGGKTAHLLECLHPQDKLVAIDVDAARCQRIEQNLHRLSLRAQVLVANAADPAQWWPVHCGSRLFDAILLDAPCTASGIVRRHPDVRWLRRHADIAQLAAQQRVLLEGLWPLLKPGGRMLYCTCSMFKAEGSEQMQTFLTRNTDAVLLSSPGYLLPLMQVNPATVPDNVSGDYDCFFYALLEKRALA